MHIHFFFLARILDLFLSFRRPKGGRISRTYTNAFTWMFPRFFTSLCYVLNDTFC